MNILCISGSSRNGNTDFLISSLAQRLEHNHNVSTVYLSKNIFNFCDGCLTCDETGICHINDGMNEIIEIIKNTDLIIFATPARWALLSAPLKNFIDRLNPLAAIEGLGGKKDIIISIGQTEGEDALGIRKAVESVKNFTDDAGMETLESFVIEGMLEKNDLQERGIVSSIVDRIEKVIEACNQSQ